MLLIKRIQVMHTLFFQGIDLPQIVKPLHSEIMGIYHPESSGSPAYGTISVPTCFLLAAGN